MAPPTLLQMALGYIVLVLIFTCGTYATYRLFEGHPITRLMFWSFVVMVFVGIVLPGALSGQMIGPALAIGASTILGAMTGRRASKK